MEFTSFLDYNISVASRDSYISMHYQYKHTKYTLSKRGMEDDTGGMEDTP